MERGKREFSLSITSANDFRSMPGLLEDEETERLSAVLREGTKFGEVWVEVPYVSRGGGYLDPIIDGWHKTVLGWSDPARKAAKMGRTIVQQSGRYSYGSASGLGDISGGIARSIGQGWNARAALKLPTGSSGDLIGSGGADLGLSLDHAFQLAHRLKCVAMAGIVYQSRGPAALGANRWVDQEGLAFIYEANSRDSWIAQWQSERAPIRTTVSAANATHRMLTFGYRRKIDANQSLDLMFSEDKDVVNGRMPEIASIAPDFTIGVRWVLRLK